MNRIDLMLGVKLTPQNYSFEEGSKDFIELLEGLRRVQIFDVGWDAQWEENGPLDSVWDNRDGYLEKFREHNKERSNGFSIWVDEASDQRLFELQYSWKNQPLLTVDMISGEIYRPHPDYGLHPQNFINMIDVITQWKRPQHLRFGPFIYMRDDHPLDRAREGIGWMGWVPFSLNSSDVPEAEMVREMNGGTLIVTQSEFWQAWPQHPQYSKAAIERAQEVEIRLNLLGVLPTTVELQRGDWGQ